MLIEIITERLVLRTNCSLQNGKFEYSDNNIINILSLEPRKTDDNGFAIYLDDNCIGHIIIMDKRMPFELSVGISEEYRNQGYMKEAMGATIEWIFDNCNTDKVFALVGPITPIASRRLCEHFGFRKLPSKDEEWWELNRNDYYKKKGSELSE